MDLLEKAAEVDIPETAITEDGAEEETEMSAEALEESLADDPAYGDLVEAVERLTPEETDEVLALGLFARNGASAEQWQAVVEQARAVPEAEATDELLRMLLLTDELETALEQLGYFAEEAEEDEETPEEEVSDEDERSEDDDDDEEPKK
ncbi:MAG TPA: DUF3775 domain-containing protein [Stellaceae bacterium]|nr:DUF3775 domain-containing protein [Stellaceae bacterium]